MQYHIFRLVKQESSILSEARLYTQQLSLFPEEDHEPTESDMDVLEQIVEYSDYLDDPDAHGNHILAADTDMDLETYEKLRSRSIREIKQTNGEISFKDDLIFQKSL